MNTKELANIKKICLHHKKMSARLVDEWVVPYTAQFISFAKMEKKWWAPYLPLLKDLPAGFKGFTAAMFLAHQAFGKKALIQKYLQHAAFKGLKDEDKSFFQSCIDQPWRTSFAKIVGNPAPDFFKMYDVLTSDTYLLYAPSISEIRKERPINLWMCLVGYNGNCYHTFGVVTGFSAFTTDDILFYATERNNQIFGEAEVANDIEEDPLHYWILFAGSQVPLLKNEGEEVRFFRSEDEVRIVSFEKLKGQLRLEWARNVFKISPLDDKQDMDFPVAYYNETEQILIRSAMKESVFKQWTSTLNRLLGLQLSDEADVAVSMAMLSFMTNAGFMKTDYFQYDKIFATNEAGASGNGDSLAALNRMLAELMQLLNGNQEVDAESLAEKHQVAVEDVRQFYEAMKKRLGH